MTPFARIVALSIAAAALAAAAPSFAALKVGDKAPDFTVSAATDGTVSTFALQDVLKNGPVVVYFYPKAFTGGCSMEAHAFSEAMPEFSAKHVSVIGLSTDDVPTLQSFSQKDCAGKFPVGSDATAAVATAYDAKMSAANMANRISYVVGTDGLITFVHDDGDAATHVPALLAAVGADK